MGNGHNVDQHGMHDFVLSLTTSLRHLCLRLLTATRAHVHCAQLQHRVDAAQPCNLATVHPISVLEWHVVMMILHAHKTLATSLGVMGSSVNMHVCGTLAVHR